MPPRVSDAAAAEPDERGEEEEEEAELPQRRAATKQRPRRSAGDPGCCQVVECGVGLEGAPPYNRRYRICNDHYRASCTTVDGIPSRFCQQCGRFHELQAFDADCRSCRKELELHNKRRRRRAAALAAAGMQPVRGRKSGASGGARPAAAARARAPDASPGSRVAAQQLQAHQGLYGLMAQPRGAADLQHHGANIMEQVLGWSALSRGGAGMPPLGGIGPGGGGDAAAHAAAANAGVAAALAAFAARHVGTGASIYGGGSAGPGLPAIPGMQLQMPRGLYGGELDGGAAALLAAGWPHGAAGGMAQGAGGLLGDMLLGLPPFQQQQQPPGGGAPDGGAGAWGAGGA